MAVKRQKQKTDWIVYAFFASLVLFGGFMFVVGTIQKNENREISAQERKQEEEDKAFYKEEKEDYIHWVKEGLVNLEEVMFLENSNTLEMWENLATVAGESKYGNPTIPEGWEETDKLYKETLDMIIQYREYKHSYFEWGRTDSRAEGTWKQITTNLGIIQDKVGFRDFETEYREHNE